MKQLWRCPVCKHEYSAAIPVSEVLCPNNHIPTRGRSARGVMHLVEGELPTELNRKKATSGNRPNRRS